MEVAPLITADFYFKALFTYTALIAVACLVMAVIVMRKRNN